MSLEGDEVFRDFFDDEKPSSIKKKSRLKSTDLMITMNLNEKFTNMTREFRDFAIDLFDRGRILHYFRDRENPTDPLANMDDVEIKWKPEVGPELGRLHLHALVAITHHGFYTFKANELRQDATNLFGQHIYLSCPVSSNERVKWESYLQKGIVEK